MKRPRSDERSSQEDPEPLNATQVILAEPHVIPSGDIALDFSGLSVKAGVKGDDM